MARTSSLPLVDKIFGGEFAEWLRTARSEGKSFEAIARTLAEEHEVNVTGETVRRWCSELGTG